VPVSSKSANSGIASKNHLMWESIQSISSSCLWFFVKKDFEARRGLQLMDYVCRLGRGSTQTLYLPALLWVRPPIVKCGCRFSLSVSCLCSELELIIVHEHHSSCDFEKLFSNKKSTKNVWKKLWDRAFLGINLLIL